MGSILIDSGSVLDTCIEKGLHPDSFYDPRHRFIFRAMLELSQAGRPIDILSVKEKVSFRKAEDPPVSIEDLAGCVEDTPTAAHAGFYVDVVLQKALLRRTIGCARKIEASCFEDTDARSVVARAEESVFSLLGDDEHAEPWSKTIVGSVSRIDEVLNGNDSFMGIPSGYLNVDSLLMGFKPEELIILAARPSMGKTSLALNIAERIALGETTDHQPRAVGVFSLEMSADSLAMRMLCSRARVRSQGLMHGALSNGQHQRIIQAASVIQKAQLYIDPATQLDIENLRARARRMCRRNDVRIIIVDYLQLVRTQGLDHRSRNEEVSAVSAGLKAMARELSIPVIVLSQLSRASEKEGQRKPRMSDLRDSGAIEQDADVICLLRRPCKLDRDPEHDDATLAVVEVAKNRNGPTGDIRLNFEDQFTRFDDRATAHESVPRDADSQERTPSGDTPPRRPVRPVHLLGTD